MGKSTTILIVLIFIVGAAAYGLWYQSQENKSMETRGSMYLEGAKLEEQRKDKQDADLKACLTKADLQYNNLKDLNSIDVTASNGEKAKQWTSSEVAIRSEDNYRKDKEFCLKLYK